MRTWIIFENTLSPTGGWMSAVHAVNGIPVQAGPRFDSREELEQFISDLQAAADRVWPQT